MPTIALVDDDKNILASVTLLLEQEGYQVKSFNDGASALAGLTASPPDLAILDIKMPRMDGMEVLRRLRQVNETPVIFLTSKDEEIDELMGLNAGADDYVRKPFSQRLLLERVKAVLRRGEAKKGTPPAAEQAKQTLVRGKLTLDPLRHECTWEGKPVRLTVTEFLILQSLALRPGFVKSRDNLMDAAYDDQVYVDDRTIDSHIKRLRKKFKVVDDDFDSIETLYGVAVRPRFSALTRRIIFFNAFALVVFIAGVFWVQANRSGLVMERIAGIQDQALIVAGALAEYTAIPEQRSINLDTAEPLLSQLITPTRLRARIYSNAGELQTDSRFLLARNVVTTEHLPPPDSANSVVAFFQHMLAAIHDIYDGLLGVRPLASIEPYFEGGKDGRVYREVVSASAGNTASAVRVNEQNRLVISVAVPIKRFGTHYGVLMLTTESGDIDAILKDERLSLIKVSLFAVAALLLSSLYLAGFIAEPIRTLAAAAERVRRGRSGRETIPTFTERQDEIGELSDSLAAMTRALYDRIDAIESFAADVAHELKNPLTSLRSAVEMLERTPPGEQRERLVSVIRNDVKRIDRLITDISDASRLDAELSRAESDKVDVIKLLEVIVEIYNGMESKNVVTVEFQREGANAAFVQGLDERLGQVFRNLIDNALSFSPENGRVRVSVNASDRIVRALVEDEGPGIPEDDLEKIFGRFYTERPPEHGFGRNSGLGLAIARQIVESHGGRIWAENRPDMRGARFVIELPLAYRIG